MNRCQEFSNIATHGDTPFHNLPDIVGQVKAKVSNTAKLLKAINSERLRLELEHAMLSLANCLGLLEQQVLLVLKKNSELEQRAGSAEQLYREAMDKSAAQLRDAQRQFGSLNNRSNKLAKQNDFLTFVNKGLRNELEEKRRYLEEYKTTHCREIKLMMRQLEQEARTGTERLCERIHQVVELCEQELQQEHRNTEGEERLAKDSSENVLEGILGSRHENPPTASKQASQVSTLKKRSQSACNAGSTGKKRLVETKLARIVLEQAKLANRNDRYIETYLS